MLQDRLCEINTGRIGESEVEKDFSINADTCTLTDIFKYRNYVIPGYQRPYEWKEPKIKDAFNCVFQSFENEEKCLFGTMQFNKRLNRNKVEQLEIIDGQQRLTTFALILRVLHCDTGFSPENQISREYEEELLFAGSKEKRFVGSVYQNNYDIIKALIEEKLVNDKQKTDFAEYIKKQIVFVRVITEFGGDSIEKTIQIFDSLNTKGLPLDRKDIFKIRFRDKVKDSEKAFERINNAYKNIASFDKNEFYNLKEDDLITAFMFWIIGNREKKESISGDLMSGSSTEFFESVFSGELPECASLVHFERLSETIKRTQEIIKDWDQTEKDRIRLLCAKELLSWSGYNKLTNLFFVFVYAKTQGKEIEEKDIINSLCLTELVWKVCSIAHAVVHQVIKSCYKAIRQNVLWEIIHNAADMECIKSKLLDYIENDNYIDINKFQNIIYGNVFENTRRHLFLAISYIDDAENEHTAFEIKQQLFYCKKWNWDAEHILTQDLYKEEKEEKLHEIGNLLYLEKKINRSLGNATKNLNGNDSEKREKDEANKRKAYQKSMSVNIHHFQAEAEKINFEQAVTERNDRKKRMLWECYMEIKEPQHS